MSTIELNFLRPTWHDHRHGPSNASSTMGRPRQRNPTTVEDRALENDVRRTDVRRLVARVQTCRVTRSCEEPVRAHQPCHGHATRNVAATDMPAPE